MAFLSVIFYRNRGAFIQPRPEKQIISNHRSLKINIAKILVLPILTPDWKPEILLEKMKIVDSKILDNSNLKIKKNYKQLSPGIPGLKSLNSHQP